MKVVLIGDSHTAGAFGQRLQSLLIADGDTVARSGQVGWGIRQWVDVLSSPGAALPDRDAAVIVALGHNDWGRPEAIPGLVDDLAEILEDATVGPLIWVGPPSTPASNADATAAAIGAALATHPRWVWVDSGPLTRDLPAKGAGGYHYLPREGATWADRVWQSGADPDTVSHAGSGDGVGVGGLLAAAGFLTLGALSLWRWLRRK